MAYAYTSIFFSINLFYRHQWKTPNFAIFWPLAYCGVLVGGDLKKLNTVAQLQTFHYATVSKSFLYFNAFMAKLCTRSLRRSKVWVTVRKTKNSVFLAATAASEIQAPLNLAWWEIENVEHVLTAPNYSGGLMHSFTVSENSGVTCPLNLKPP